MNEYTKIFLEAYGDSVFEDPLDIKTKGYLITESMVPVTEGFIGELWNKIVEIFKKMWNAVVKFFKNIKDYFTKTKAERDKEKNDAMYKEAMKVPFTHKQKYDHKALMNKFNFADNALHDLFVVLLLLKTESKTPDKFDQDKFKSSHLNTLKKYCDVDESGGRLGISMRKEDIDPLEPSEKEGRTSWGEADSFVKECNTCLNKYKASIEFTQKLGGGSFDAVADADQFKNSIHFIRGTAMTLCNALMTCNLSLQHTLRCMQQEMNAITKSEDAAISNK